MHRPPHLWLWAASGILVLGSAAAQERIERRAPADVPHDAVLLDVRPLAVCRERSLQGARCLPADDLLRPDGRLADFGGILWALGTAGLEGGETVAVFGAQSVRRDFVAGVLLVAGQRRVIAVSAPASELMQGKWRPIGPGRARGMLRDPIWQAPMRDHLLVLPRELARAVADEGTASVWDAREPGSAQGGIPGARLAPRSRELGGEGVWYGRKALDSLALLAALCQPECGARRVLLDGLLGWRRSVAAVQSPAAGGWQPVQTVGAVLVLLALGLTAAGWVATRRRRWS